MTPAAAVHRLSRPVGVLTLGLLLGCDALAGPGPSFATARWSISMPRTVSLVAVEGPHEFGATWASGPRVDPAAQFVRLVMPGSRALDERDVIALATTLPGTALVVDETVVLGVGQARHVVTIRGASGIRTDWFIFEGRDTPGLAPQVGYLRIAGLRLEDAISVARSLVVRLP